MELFPLEAVGEKKSEWIVNSLIQPLVSLSVPGKAFPNCLDNNFSKDSDRVFITCYVQGSVLRDSP